MKREDDFDLAALYEALDAQRRARGLFWAQATREINRYPERAGGHPISASTVTGLRTKSVAEGDGIPQMLLWVHRTPESFLPGHERSAAAIGRLPDVPPNQILRFNTRKLHVALNARRMERKMTWAQVGQEIGASGALLASVAA